MIIISDTSPITSLIRIKQIEILKKIYSNVIIPKSVYNELLVEHKRLPSFIIVEKVIDKKYADFLKIELDEGEAEAIALAKEKKAAFLLIDEMKGRLIAEREGITIIGLIGVLLAAKKKGLISSIKEMIELLQTNAGFWISEEFKTRILDVAGESK